MIRDRDGTKINDDRQAGVAFHERLIPYRGNWCLPWVIQRYLGTARSAFTLKKAFNAGLAMVEMWARKTRVRSRPYVLRIEPANLCNLRCPRCICGLGIDPRPQGFMALADYETVLQQNRRHGAIVRLDGMGEATMHPDIFEMIRMAKSYGYSVSMSTNFNSSACAEPEKFINAGLDRIIVAVDGATQDSYERYRSGGSLALIEERLIRLYEVRKRLGARRPFMEVQFLDWGYNHDDIPLMRQKVGQWGADKLEVISPDWAVGYGQVVPNRPRRCFWLWAVVTVDWQLNYRSCTNAWSLPWPRLNMKDVPIEQYWNHELMVQARQYNLDTSSDVISDDAGCHCNNCHDMLVVERPPEYVCE